jgi:tetrahydromethanopterin S-methyltransferase subunit G
MQTMVEEREVPMELDDAEFKRIDERFEDVNRRITEGREETKQRFDRVEGDIRELKQGLFAVQGTLNRFILGAATSWVILMVTILARG